MGYKIFISYKYGDSSVQRLARTPHGERTIVRHYVDEIQARIKADDHINKGELDGEDLSMFKDETIKSKLRDKIYDSSVTIVLISPRMKDPYIPEGDQWILWEISYSLREVPRSDRVSRTNALLGVVLSDVTGSCEYVITNRTCCPGGCVFLNRTDLFTIIQENTFNRKRPPIHDCEKDTSIWEWPFSYMHIVSWYSFLNDMDAAINNAIQIRDRIQDFDIHKQIK